MRETSPALFKTWEASSRSRTSRSTKSGKTLSNIFYENNYYRDISAVRNLDNVMVELSNGPLQFDRMLSANGKWNHGADSRLCDIGTTRIEHSVLYYGIPCDDAKHARNLMSVRIDWRMLPETTTATRPAAR